MDAPKGKRVMSAKEFREYADECMRSAKMAKSVKERRDFYRIRKLGFRPPIYGDRKPHSSTVRIA